MNKSLLLSVFFTLFFSITFSQNISISSDSDQLNEGGEADVVTITATSDVAIDATYGSNIPVTLTGTATKNEDYSYTFSTLNQESTLFVYQNYGAHRSHDDGRIITLHESNFNVFDNNTLTNYSLQRNYHNHFELVENKMYVKYDNNSIYSIDISDLDNIVETEIIAYTDSGFSIYNFSIEGNKLIYLLHDPTHDFYYKVMTLEIGSEAVHIADIHAYNASPFLLNDVAYIVGSWGISYAENFNEASNANPDYHLLSSGFEIDSNKKPFIKNSKVYLFGNEPNDGSDFWQVVEADLNSQTFTWLQPEMYTDLESYDLDNLGNLNTYSYTNGNLELNSYQLSPVINIPFNATTGTITFSLINDNSNEADETIIITPGTPTNGTLTDSSALTVTITDNDDAAAVTFALSSDSIDENSSSTVTLTATADPVSGVDITIPFTLSGTAGSDEYTVSGTEIVIPAGSSTASVTISTSGLDDDEVEVIETIIFTFGEITNGTTETTDVTLNLESEDEPNSSLSATNPDMNEGESTSITLEIDAPTSQDVIVPLNLTGTATFDIDYTTEFDTQGDERIVMSVANYDYFAVLEDGRYLFTDGGGLHLYNPEDQSHNQYYLDQYWNELYPSGEYIYLKRNTQIAKFHIDQFDTSDGSNNIIPEIVIDSDVLGNNDYFESRISVEGDNLVYQIYDWPVGRKVYKKSGDNDSELMYDGSSSADNLLLYNDRIYNFQYNTMTELYDGEYVNPVYYSDQYFYQAKVFNGNVYVLTENNVINNREIVKIDVENDIINSVGSSASVISLPYEIGEGIDYIRRFAFDSNGNLLLYNQINNSTFGVFSYQFYPEITIPAGATTGSFTFDSTDDSSYEDDETIIITPGDPVNATITSEEPLTLNIIDDDNPPVITFELSSDNIVENSEYSVTLTATADVQSGIEITIPFTMGGDALPEEYELSAESIVIAPNVNSGNITISTFGYDDNEVEVAESIIFTFGEITNATTETSSITLTLLSEDNSTLSSVEIDQTELTEGESTTLTVTVEEPSSNDIYLPIIFGGTAIAGDDFISEFAAQGEQSLIAQLDNNSFDRYGILADGRHVFLNSSEIRIMSADGSSENIAQLNSTYWWMEIEGNTIYIANHDRIAIVDITDISANQVEIEEIVTLDNVSMNGYNFSVENGKVLYGVIADGSGSRQLWLLESIESDPVLLGSGLNCCYAPLLINGNIYRLETWGYRLFSDGEDGQEFSYNGYTNAIDRGRELVVKNGILYGFAYGQNSGDLVQIDLAAGNGLVSQAFNIDIGEEINNTRSFDFAPNGNIILVNEVIENNQTISQLNSYLVAAELKVNAGETTGSIIINTIDDDSYEFDESITINYGTPINANIGDVSGSEIIIIDNDLPPLVTFELSSENIVENATDPVTLTATLSEVSGYDVTIPFTVSGTAGEDEYSVSALSIVIPAGSDTGNVEVSTADLDDEEVEMLETIIFTFGELTNATTEATEIILNLESDDDPNLVSVEAEPLEFAEHEFSTITATIDQATSRDVLVPVDLAGTATLNLDYSVSFESLGDAVPLYISSEPYNFLNVLADGRLVGGSPWNNHNLYVHELDGTITQIYLSEPAYDLTTYQNDIYFTNNRKIIKYDLSSSSEELIYEYTGNNDVRRIEVVNDKIFVMYMNNDAGNLMTFDYIADGNDPVNIAEHGGYPGDGLHDFAVNSQEEIFATNGQGIWKPQDQTELQENGLVGFENVSIYDMKFFDDLLYVNYYSYQDNAGRITNINIYDYTIGNNMPWITPESIGYIDWSSITSYINGYTIDNSGQILITINETNSDGQYEITSYKTLPELIISAGELTGSIVVQGMEDNLNAPGEETDETIEITILEPLNANIDESNTIEDITLTILNNEIDLAIDENALANVPAMTSSSVAWGDFDRDGDQDMAVMGVSFFDGVITRLYENIDGVFVNSNPGVFAPTYEGDLLWVDYNKDGYIDLVVSGLDPNDNPSTVIYENINGVSFNPSLDMTLPNLFSTSMDSGDLDNDGDIDFIINGQDANNNWKKYIYKREGFQLNLEEDYNGQFNGDQGYINGVVRMADSGNDGDIDIYMMGNNDSRIKMNTYINESNDWWNYYLPNLQNASMVTFGDYIYYMGQDGDEMRFYRKSLEGGEESQLSIEGLIDGDIAIGDYNNDGYEDLVVTGENSLAEPITKLYDGNAFAFTENTDIELLPLRSSTAKWVDYDMDGDLDLFLNGTNDDGEFSVLYKTNLDNKSNNPSEVISNLAFENLGNGKVRLSWDEPQDDFSNNLGYVVRLGTTESGSELSNTESNLETGQRLITKSTQINTNSYEILLDPGNYFWSVQSVDTGLRGSAFSEEASFQLTYEWKLLNQGGIIDRSISSIDQPIVKLTDIDGDNDMDLVYGSRSADADIQIFRLGDSSFEYFDFINDARSITDIEFLDINNDLVLDIIANTWNNSQSNFFRLYNSTSTGGFNNVFSAPGLYQAKIELIDINNDGTQEIIHAGRTSESANSELKIYVYEQNGNTLSDEPLDISDQVSGLKQGAFGFGNIDLDEDIDFGITGLSNFGAQSNVYINETVFTETVAPIFTLTSVDFPAAYESTLDFIDYDGDGDLDIMLTGTGANGPMFKVFANNGLDSDQLDFIEVENTGLTPIRNANIDYGDYNGDGYLDMLYTGTVSGQGEVTKLMELDPNTLSYIESDFDLSDIVNASIAFGDVDGDNDLDFTIAGESSSNNNNSIIKTYLNVRNESAEVEASSGGNIVDTGSVMASFNTETNFVVNDRPSTPDGLSASIESYDPESEIYKVKFSWNPSTDDHTPTEGLTYALKIGTSNGGDEIMKVNALPNGYRLSAGKGNVEHSVEWVLNLTEDTYYWSVQSIDASFSGSYFSDTESVFVIDNGPAIAISSPSNNTQFEEDTETVEIEFEITNFELSDDGSGDGYIMWSINGEDQSPLYNTENIIIDVEIGSYIIDLWFVDNDDNEITGTNTSVSFTVGDVGPPYSLTMTVNTANIDVGPNGMYLGGGVFGGAMAYPMSDDDGDGVWEVTIEVEEGFSGHYIFLNNPQYDSDWDAKEDLTGLDCADPDNWNDRFLEPVNSDRTLMHCFGSCETDGSCPGLSTNDNEISGMFIYPNPVDGNFVNILSPINGIKKIEIYSLTGRKLMENMINGDILNVSSLNTGFYMMKVSIEDQSKIFKLIIR